MNKRISIFLLLGAILFLQVAWLPVYFELKYQAKTEMRERIESGVPTENLTRFSHSLDASSNAQPNFQILDEGKEIRFEGKLFDVVSSQKNGKELIFYCLSDEKENSLESVFLTQKNNNSDQGGNSSNQTKLCSKLLLLNFISTENFKKVQNDFITFLKPVDEISMNRNFTIIFSPPPELFA